MTLANLKIFLENAKKKEDTALVKMLEERIERRIAKYIKMGRIKVEEPKPKKEKKDVKGSA